MGLSLVNFHQEAAALSCNFIVLLPAAQATPKRMGQNVADNKLKLPSALLPLWDIALRSFHNPFPKAAIH